MEIFTSPRLNKMLHFGSSLSVVFAEPVKLLHTPERPMATLHVASLGSPEHPRPPNSGTCLKSPSGLSIDGFISFPFLHEDVSER